LYNALRIKKRTSTTRIYCCWTRNLWHIPLLLFTQSRKKFIVYDEAKPFTASKVASGVINPVTGRRIVKTWMIDDVMPFTVNAYQTLEKELNVSLIQQANILDFHPTTQMQLAFDERLPQETDYLKKLNKQNNGNNISIIHLALAKQILVG
jgi:hypothetical protein